MFKPLADRVLVRRGESVEVTPGGIIIPPIAREPSLEGVVVAVGPGSWDGAQRLPMPVSVGDKVVFPRQSGTEIVHDMTLFTVLSSKEVTGVVFEL